MLKPKTKKCKHCKNDFIAQFNTNTQVCSIECAIAFSEKKEKQKLRKAKKDYYADNLPKLKVKAQKKCNEYIRLRDEILNKRKVCCSCQKQDQSKQYHAGHFISVGVSGSNRYNEYNIHLQCMTCNYFKSGNRTEYDKFMIKKYGVKFVDNLILNSNQTYKYTVDDLNDIYQYYLDKIKIIKKKT